MKPCGRRALSPKLAMVVAYVGHASTVPPPVTLAVVSWLCELTRFEPVRDATRPCATLPESATPAQRARTAIAGNTRDLAMRSSDGYGMRPCSPFAFLIGLPTSTDPMDAKPSEVSGGDRIFTALARTGGSVRNEMRSKILITRINICYELVIEATPVCFLQAWARSVWQRTCEPAVECSWWTTTRSSAIAWRARSPSTDSPLVGHQMPARPSI